MRGLQKRHICWMSLVNLGVLTVATQRYQAAHGVEVDLGRRRGDLAVNHQLFIFLCNRGSGWGPVVYYSGYLIIHLMILRRHASCGRTVFLTDTRIPFGDQIKLEHHFPACKPSSFASDTRKWCPVTVDINFS